MRAVRAVPRAPMLAAPLSTSATQYSAKAAAPKKKVAVRKGAGAQQRSTGGRRKGGVDVRVFSHPDRKLAGQGLGTLPEDTGYGLSLIHI